MKKSLFSLFVLFLLLQNITSAFAGEASFALKKAYIDDAVSRLEPSFYQQIKEYDTADADYPGLIDYVVEKAEDLIFQEEYQYSRDILDAVLLNNMNHSQAQELYLLVEDILREESAQKQEALKKEEEKKQQEEAEAAQLAEEKKKEEAYQARLDEKQKELDQAEAYKTSISTVSKDNFSVYLAVAPAFLSSFSSEVYEAMSGQDGSAFLYGFSGQAGGAFKNPVLFIGCDTLVDYGFIPLKGDAPDVSRLYINGALSVGSPLLPVPLVLRGGFQYNSYNFSLMAEEFMAVLDLSSPFIGLGITDLPLFSSLRLSAACDYLLSSFTMEHLDHAFCFNGGLTVDIIKKEKILLFTVLSGQALFLREEGMYEKDYSGRLGIGISYNE